MILRRHLLFLAVFVSALAASERWTRAESSAEGRVTAPFDDITIIADGTLVEMRAGFATALGLEIEFGVIARTVVDGHLVLETSLNFSNDDAWPISPAVLSRIERALPGFTMIAAGQSEMRADEAPSPNVGVSTLIDGPGVFFNDGDANAAGFVHVASGQALNVLASVGMGQRIDQQLNLIFSLKGFSGFQQDARAARAADNLLDLMAPH